MPRRRKYPSHFQAALDAAAPTDFRPRAARVELVLPFPPSVNHSYRPFKDAAGRARIGKTSAARKYAKGVEDAFADWMLENGRRGPAPPYQLLLHAYPPDNKREHDLDNLLKLAIDSVFGALNRESIVPRKDSDIFTIHAEKHDPHEGDGYIRVILLGETS